MTSTSDAAGDVVELAAVPTLGGLYARGVAGSLVTAAAGRRSVRADALPGTRLVVRGVRADAAHLSEYQHLLGEPALDVLPAGFVHVLAFPVATALMVRREFPLPLLGLVHLANRVEQRRAITLHDELEVEVHADGLRRHRSGAAVDLVATVRVDDEVAWVGRSTYLAKGTTVVGGAEVDGVAVDRVEGDGGVEGVGAGMDGAEAELAEVRRGAGPRTGEGGATAPVPTGRWTLAADTGRRYAAVSGDQNPIHTNPLAAKALGFPRAIAHGMYTAARALADIGPAGRGDAFTWDVTFAKPVLLPSTVAVRVSRPATGPKPAVTPSGWTYDVWSPRSGRHHLTGTVQPRHG